MTVKAADNLHIEDFQKKFRYHHGNLRDALLAAALDILATEGIQGLSLRALAKVTGVTQAAPYSHFQDKEDLLAAIAEKGFQQLALKMAEEATGASGVQQRVERLVTSYILFALDNKALFGVMFGRELADMKKHPTLAMTAGKSYALFSTALSKLQGQDTRFLTVAVWSLCHGLTTLLIDERLKIEQFGTDSIEAFVQKNVALFSQSLA